jgi:hypothetical protein
MAAIDVKTGVYLPPYSLQNAYSIGSNPSPLWMGKLLFKSL